MVLLDSAQLLRKDIQVQLRYFRYIYLIFVVDKFDTCDNILLVFVYLFSCIPSSNPFSVCYKFCKLLRGLDHGLLRLFLLLFFIVNYSSQLFSLFKIFHTINFKYSLFNISFIKLFMLLVLEILLLILASVTLLILLLIIFIVSKLVGILNSAYARTFFLPY